MASSAEIDGPSQAMTSAARWCVEKTKMSMEKKPTGFSAFFKNVVYYKSCQSGL